MVASALTSPQWTVSHSNVSTIQCFQREGERERNDDDDNNNNGHFYGAESHAKSKAQCSVQKNTEKCINNTMERERVRDGVGRGGGGILT